MSAPDREVLFLLSDFPPTPRAAKLLRHLPAFGWSCRVLYPRRRTSGRYGVGAPGLKGTPATSTYSPPALSSLLAPRLASARGTTLPGSTTGPRGVVETLGRRLLLWTNTPDDMVGWLPFALYAGIRLIRRHPVRAIVASGPPFTTVLLGWLLTLLTSRPLLVDMRDAWAEDESDPFGTIGGRFRAPYGKLRIRTLRRLEGTVIKAARGIFFTSTYTLRRYLERYPGAAPRSELVLNGVEESDFAREPPATNAFTFAYVGTLHDYQLPDVERFLAAFAHALTVDPSFGSARVFLAGHHGAALAKHLEALVSQYRLGDCVTIAGPIPHEEAIDVLKAAGTILLVAGANPFVRLTKIPEAAAAQRPVLVLAAPGSETARCATDLGQTVSSGQSIQELAGLLLRFRGAERPGVAGFPFPYPHPANWRAAAEQVARRLDTVTREAR